MMTWYISVCVGGESIVEKSFMLTWYISVWVVYQCVGGERLVGKEFPVRQDRHWFWRVE